jgi:putative lipoprotein (rSAM/lipoprotein system)
MKKRLLKTYDKLLLALLGLFPFFSACDDEPRDEYGMPNADYIFKGTVTSDVTGKPVDKIQVTLSKDDVYEMQKDTTYTDADGNYSFEYHLFASTDLSAKIKVEDIDGTINGGTYKTQEDSVYIDEDNWDKSDAGDWYKGKATAVKDFKLKK